jgi:hypothetical protein
MMTKKLTPLLFWIILPILFIVLSTSISLVTAGFQFDWQSKRLTQTGLIFLAGSPKKVEVFSNGELIAQRLPVNLSSVAPGEYNVEIKKEGYVTWRKAFYIESGEARSESDIILFWAQPEVSEVTDPQLIESVKINSEPSPLISGQEIRLNNRLVTRVSGTLRSAVLGPDRSHIFFQVDREIRVIEKDGGNETLLFLLGEDAPSQLLLLDEAEELALLDQGVVKRLRIR